MHFDVVFHVDQDAAALNMALTRACPANGKLNPCQLADILIYSQ